MRKKLLAFIFAAALLMALAVPLFGGVGTALADGPNGTPACNGLNVAHGRIDGSGTQGETRLAELQVANGCVVLC